MGGGGPGRRCRREYLGRRRQRLGDLVGPRLRRQRLGARALAVADPPAVLCAVLVGHEQRSRSRPVHCSRPARRRRRSWRPASPAPSISSAGPHSGGIGGQQASLAGACGDDIDGGVAVEGTTVYLPCLSGTIAVPASASPARLRLLWSSSVGGGPPIIAAGLIWTIGQDGDLYGLDPSTGSVRERATVGAPANHFPTPSVGAGLLLAPASDRVVAFSASVAATATATTTTTAAAHTTTTARRDVDDSRPGRRLLGRRGDRSLRGRRSRRRGRADLGAGAAPARRGAHPGSVSGEQHLEHRADAGENQ